MKRESFHNSKLSFNRKEHWESIYSNKPMEEVSWYQEVPQISLELFKKYKIPKEARILDVGGGDSYLVDYLLNLGYKHISVLDVSEKAIQRAQQRLGANAAQVHWIVSDIVDFKVNETFDVWHDRAAFHFLTTLSEIHHYTAAVSETLTVGGWFFVGTFSTDGPTKCSGLEIQQYSEESLSRAFQTNFTKEECFIQKHKTPFQTLQEFLFCSFRKK